MTKTKPSSIEEVKKEIYKLVDLKMQVAIHEAKENTAFEEYIADYEATRNELIDQLLLLFTDYSNAREQQVLKEVGETFFGQILIAKMAAEFRYVDGTGKQKPDYEQIVTVYGDWLKKKLIPSDQKKDTTEEGENNESK